MGAGRRGGSGPVTSSLGKTRTWGRRVSDISDTFHGAVVTRSVCSLSWKRWTEQSAPPFSLSLCPLMPLHMA